MKTIAERLDEEERACDEQERMRKMVADALRRGRKDAADMLERTRGMFGLDLSKDTLVLR